MRPLVPACGAFLLELSYSVYQGSLVKLGTYKRRIRNPSPEQLLHCPQQPAHSWPLFYLTSPLQWISLLRSSSSSPTSPKPSRPPRFRLIPITLAVLLVATASLPRMPHERARYGSRLHPIPNLITYGKCLDSRAAFCVFRHFLILARSAHVTVPHFSPSLNPFLRLMFRDSSWIRRSMAKRPCCFLLYFRFDCTIFGSFLLHLIISRGGLLQLCECSLTCCGGCFSGFRR